MDTIDPLQLSKSAMAATSRSFFRRKRGGSHIDVPEAAKGPYGLTTLAEHITFLIGQYGHRLVCLHCNGWIFSAGPEAFNLDSCVKHIFIPADWLSTNNGDPINRDVPER